MLFILSAKYNQNAGVSLTLPDPLEQMSSNFQKSNYNFYRFVFYRKYNKNKIGNNHIFCNSGNNKIINVQYNTPNAMKKIGM